MKTPNLIIRIPEPCHEDWNNMQPDAKGKFCTSCSKSVIDFSNKTDEQIGAILLQHEGQKVCGHFKKTQIDRPLNIRINLRDLPKNMSTTRAFAVALFLVFGTFLFSCTNPQGKKVEGIEIVNTQPEERMQAAMITPIVLTPPDSLLPQQFITTCHIENYVAGGIRVERYPEIEDLLPTIDSAQVTEHFMRGEIAAIVPPQKDTTITTDSLEIKNTDRQISVPVNSKQTTLSVYPNPGNGEFTIKYDLLKRADVKVDMFDERGKLVKTLVNVNSQFEGKYQIPVNATDLPNGMYIVSMINNGERFTERIIIEK